MANTVFLTPVHESDMQNPHRKNIKTGRKKKNLSVQHISGFLIPKHPGTDPNLGNNLQLKFQLENELKVQRVIATIPLNSKVTYAPFFPCPYHSSVFYLTSPTVCTFFPQFVTYFLQCDQHLPLSTTKCDGTSHLVPFPTTHFVIPCWFPPPAQIFESPGDLPRSCPTEDRPPYNQQEESS